MIFNLLSSIFDIIVFSALAYWVFFRSDFNKAWKILFLISAIYAVFYVIWEINYPIENFTLQLLYLIALTWIAIIAIVLVIRYLKQGFNNKRKK